MSNCLLHWKPSAQRLPVCLPGVWRGVPFMRNLPVDRGKEKVAVVVVGDDIITRRTDDHPSK